MGGVLGIFAVIFMLAYSTIKNNKEEIGFDRNIPDKEIIKRLLAYAKPHWKSFVFVLVLMLFSISYDIVSPLLIGEIQGLIKAEFLLKDLFVMIAVYASILIVTLVSSVSLTVSPSTESPLKISIKVVHQMKFLNYMAIWLD
jgi:ATP-binding cassette subfamily B protein